MDQKCPFWEPSAQTGVSQPGKGLRNTPQMQFLLLLATFLLVLKLGQKYFVWMNDSLSSPEQSYGKALNLYFTEKAPAEQ